MTCCEGTRPACCGSILIQTFIFSGAELWCPRCGTAYGMFGYPDRVPVTPEIEAALEADLARFREVAAGVIPRGSRLKGCERCELGHDHIGHATEEELRASAAAWTALRGGLDDG